SHRGASQGLDLRRRPQVLTRFVGRFGRVGPNFNSHPITDPRCRRQLSCCRNYRPEQSAMLLTQSEKAARFRDLHAGPTFIIPNPWDPLSARLLAGLGFQALATSSAASANAIGKRDHQLTRDEAVAHARAIVDATDLPVSADLENGFGDQPEVVAET